MCSTSQQETGRHSFVMISEQNASHCKALLRLDEIAGEYDNSGCAVNDRQSESR